MEISAEFFGMNEGLDLFGVRDGLCDGCGDDSVGDAVGARLLVAYAATPRLGFAGEWGRGRIDAGLGAVKVDNWQLRAKGLPWQWLQVEVGVRGHELAALTVAAVDDLDRLLGYVDDKVSLRDIGSHLLISDGTTNLLLLKSGEQLFVRHDPARDRSLFGRVALLTPAEKRVRGGLFAEAGVTRIEGRIVSNYPQLVGTLLASQTMDFPLDLARDERFYKIGAQVTVAPLCGAFWNLVYSYERIERGAGLAYIDDNHVVSGDLIVPLGAAWALSLGGTVWQRQFNGEIPLLYSRYTKTTFDHAYALARLGLLYVF